MTDLLAGEMLAVGLLSVHTASTVSVPLKTVPAVYLLPESEPFPVVVIVHEEKVYPDLLTVSLIV